MIGYATNANIRRDLLDAFVEAAVPETGYKAVFPRLSVPSRSGAVKVLPMSSVGTPTSVTRASGAAYEDITMTLQSVNYQCADYGLSVSLDMAQEYPLNMEIDAARALRQRLEQQLEIAAQDILWNTTTGAIRSANGNLTTLTTPWSDASSDPVADVESAKDAISAACGGYMPNVMIIAPDTYNALLSNANVIGRQPATVLRGSEGFSDALASMFGLERVVVSRHRNATNWIWADTATLAVAATDGAPGSDPSACRFVYWPEDGEPDSSGWVVDTVDNEVTRSHYVRARINGQFLVVSVRGLYGLANTV